MSESDHCVDMVSIREHAAISGVEVNDKRTLAVLLATPSPAVGLTAKEEMIQEVMVSGTVVLSVAVPSALGGRDSEVHAHIHTHIHTHVWLVSVIE